MTNETMSRMEMTREPYMREREEVQRQQQQQAAPAMRQAQLVPCPHCGAPNEPEAMFCASCGQPIGQISCPNCGAVLDPDADFCESCHHYICHDVCSFCGAQMQDAESFCPSCGSPRGGIVCPTCRTLNDFAFCKQCGQPLTEGARMLQEQVRQTPEYIELQRLAKQYDELSMEMPEGSERDRLMAEECDRLRERVLQLLAQDAGETDAGAVSASVSPVERPRKSKAELDAEKDMTLQLLGQLLDRMAMPPQPHPVQVRNYAMAQKPAGVRLAWQCNYKHAMHSSPCGCAKPHLGGKWIVLGRGTHQEIKDDK